MRKRLLGMIVYLTAAGFLIAGLVVRLPAAQAANPPGRLAGVSLLYTQPAHPAGGLFLSSLRDPNGSDNDQWVWDAFTLTWSAEIREIRWSGGYDPARQGMGGPVHNFTVSIFASKPGVSQPDLTKGPLVRYEVGGNANETAGQVLGNLQMYDYSFILPAAFPVAGGTKYWMQIEAYQPGSLPDWGLTRGAGGDGFHFRKIAGETVYHTMAGDTAFSLLGTQAAPRATYLPYLQR